MNHSTDQEDESAEAVTAQVRAAQVRAAQVLAAQVRTRLDAVREEARREAAGCEGGAPDDAAAGRFLDVLLAEGLICPAAPAPEAARGPADDPNADAAFEPLVGAHEGAPTLLVFDALERLEAGGYGGGEYIAAPGHVMFAVAAARGLPIALNAGLGEAETAFSAETVAMIAELAEAAAEEECVGAEEAIEILSPAPPSEAMLAALSARLAAAAEALGGRLSGAWLIEVARAGAGGAGRAPEAGDAGAESVAADEARPAEAAASLTLALAVAAEAEAESAALGALARDLSRLGGVLAPERGLDVAILREGERALAAARRVGVGLLAPRDAA